jgi:protein arginine kinase
MKFIELPKDQDRKKNQLDSFVFSTRVRLARNIDGLPFPLMLKDEQKSQLDSKICEVMKTLPFETHIESIHDMDKERIMAYLSNHVFTNEFIRNGRTMIAENTGDWVMLLNEDDHIRLFSIDSGYNPKSTYNRLSDVLDRLEKKVDYSFDETYGYLSSSILNVGTGLRISCLVNLYGLVATKKIEFFMDSANKIGYSIISLSEEADSGLFFIYNIFSLGVSEEDILTEFDEFITKTYHLEKKARDEFFDKKEEVEIAFEELFELNIKDKLDWPNLVYYISLIDGLNTRFITLKDIQSFRKLVYQASDEYLMNKNHIDAEFVDGVRMNQLKKYISHFTYKKEKLKP